MQERPSFSEILTYTYSFSYMTLNSEDKVHEQARLSTDNPRMAKSSILIQAGCSPLFSKANLALIPVPSPTFSPCFLLKNSKLSFTFQLLLFPVVIRFIMKALLTKLFKQRCS